VGYFLSEINNPTVYALPIPKQAQRQWLNWLKQKITVNKKRQLPDQNSGREISLFWHNRNKGI
jgi:hypothetical protein